MERKCEEVCFHVMERTELYYVLNMLIYKCEEYHRKKKENVKKKI